MNMGIDWMSVLGAVVILVVVVWIFLAVSYMNSKGKSQDGTCGSGKCSGNCMSCSFGKGAAEEKENDKIK